MVTNRLTALSAPPRALAMAAPPPIQRETYLAAMRTVRQLILTWKGAGDAQDAFAKGIAANEALAEIAEKVIMSIATLEDKMATLESIAAREAPLGNRKRPLAESKCIGNLKTLGSDKSEFKVWSDKFINAVAQSLE